MARPLRYVPADSLVEVTCRTLHGRFLLRPSRDLSGKTPLGVRRILRQDPHSRPERTHHSPAPRFHAQAWRVRKSLELAYHEFRLRFRQAAEDLKLGRPGVEFPAGSFPPPLPRIGPG